MNLLEKFANPELLSSLTFGEKLNGALLVTVIGMGITFLALLLLMGATILLSKLVYKDEEKSVSIVKAKKKAKGPSIVSETDEELIAVLAAAIAAASGKALNTIVIKGYREISGNIPAWSNSSLMNRNI